MREGWGEGGLPNTPQVTTLASVARHDIYAGRGRGRGGAPDNEAGEKSENIRGQRRTVGNKQPLTTTTSSSSSRSGRRRRRYAVLYLTPERAKNKNKGMGSY